MRHVCILVAVLGCGTGSDQPAGIKVVEGRAPAIGRAAKAPPINALEPYERLVRAFDVCGLEGNQIAFSCPARAAFESQMQGVSSEIRAKVGVKMLGHASPAVRVQAATMVRMSELAHAATTERDPRVVAAFVRIAGKHGARDPQAASLLLAAARHADSSVRQGAIDMIATNRGMPGALETLMTLAETDADSRVRRGACELAGRMGDDGVLPLYERTTATAPDPDFYAACMEGLAARVMESEAAYRLFMRRITDGPRTAHTPPWTVMSIFCDGSGEPAWFDRAEVRRVLASVIADRAVGMQARSAAIESLAALEATPAELSALKKTLVAAADKPLLEKIVAICESR